MILPFSISHSDPTSYLKEQVNFFSEIRILRLTYLHDWAQYLGLKCASGQEEVVPLGHVSRGFGRQNDGEKVIVVNLGYFST